MKKTFTSNEYKLTCFCCFSYYIWYFCLIFEEQPKYPSAVNTKIKEMALSSTQQEQLKDVIDTLLTDVFYSVLLGLDGENSIGNTQQTYKIYDEKGNLISDCGELEVSAYEYFHEGKYEGCTFAPDSESH